MKVVIVSDNHGQRLILEKIVKQYEGQDVTFVHCGDSEFEYGDFVMAPFVRVTGNCDYDLSYPEGTTVRVNGVTIYVTHGHLQWVNSGVDRLAAEAKANGATIALYGHTHKLREETEDGVLCINSGSVSYPRGHFATTPTYAVLDIQDSQHVTLTYMTTQHEALSGMTYDYHYEEGRGLIHD